MYKSELQEQPEREKQPVNNPLATEYAALNTWADIFRRSGLDERDHRNNSFLFCGKQECVVKYGGMLK